MRVDELFRSPTSLQKFDGDAIRQLGMYDIVSAYGAKIGEADYVFYFDNCSKQEGDYGFGFGVRRSEGGVDHALTKNSASPVKVFTAALQAIENFINEADPLNVSFTGADSRQMQFYNVLSKRLAGEVPSGYKLLQRVSHKPGEGRLYLTRDQNKIEDRFGYTELKESRIDELFDAPVAEYELEDISVSEARMKYHVDEFETAYVFNVQGEEYIVYFTPIMKYGRGWYDCSFGKHKDGDGIVFNLTGSSPRDQYKVFRMVLAGINRFIATRRPVGISGDGFVKRQSAFYANLMKAYESRLPKPYFWAMDGGKVLITRSKAVVPERDHLDRLKAAEQPVEEGAVEDVEAHKTAEQNTNTFINWLAKENEDKPVEDIMHYYGTLPNYGIYYVRGDEIGLADDLWIGLAWSKDGSKQGAEGFMRIIRNTATGKTFYMVMLVVSHDPAHDKEVAWGLRHDHMVHEFTHYLDRKRQPKPSSNPSGKIAGAVSAKGGEAYYNHPLEFNAFFQQGVHQLMREFRARPPVGSRMRPDYQNELGTFEGFLKEYISAFDWNFRDHLNPIYKRKLMRRLYKLYGLMKANPKDFERVEAAAKEFDY